MDPDEYEDELAARDHAIVELTLACFALRAQIEDMAKTMRELMVETSNRIDVVVH